MKIRLPEKTRIKTRVIIIYIIIALICVISFITAFYIQFYARINLMAVVGINSSNEFGNKTDEQKEIIKTDFENIFTNSIKNDESRNIDKKADKTRSLVYETYVKKDSKENSYDINVHIPHMNIESDIIDKYNKEIEDIFVAKAENVLKTENKNIIYTVEYVANVQDDILSLMIRSNLKEGVSAQRVIIQTYSYDLRNNKELNLEDIIRIKELDKQSVQNDINNVIKLEQKKVEDLKKLGYKIFSRDVNSDIYKIENSKEFYLTEDTLYVIYAYGNDSFTSEIDTVVI